ncbi:Opacity protein [Rhodoferax sp. OV413]|uniref:outer membrane beta-barrel protein n=1 Tax=Rhodoferax sp. OV413 TaxID=1855285 RepID=UPI000887C651|nr:outer membrane beta-barrel protein [Rhodoferax sp. OV413]SDP94577.1 Opacity protein [Rhodoferax sp. OV413]
MKLNVFFSSIACVPLGLALAAPLAHAADPAGDVYVGGGLSVSRASGLGGKIDSALSSQGIASSTSADHSSTNPNFRLGYRINPNVAVEASYDRVGKMDLQSAISSPTADSASGTWKGHGLGLHVLGIAPLDDKWSLYGRVGVERWKTSLDLASNAGGSTGYDATSSHTSLALGAGAAYAISRNVDATAELVHYNHVGDATSTGRTGLNQFNFGLRYHFM